MKDKIAGVKAEVKETVRETTDQIKAKTKEVASEAREQGEHYFLKGKQRAAARIGGVSDSIRQAADRFEQEHDPNIARYTRLLADKLEQAATYVRERDLNQLKRDGEDIARQHPGLFFGGMFVAGLAAARFLKASAERNESPERSFPEQSGGSEPEEVMAASASPSTPTPEPEEWRPGQQSRR